MQGCAHISSTEGRRGTLARVGERQERATFHIANSEASLVTPDITMNVGEDRECVASI
jgi:hypothetical protein